MNGIVEKVKDYAKATKITDPVLKKSINELGDIKKELARLKGEIEPLAKRASVLESDLIPIIEALEDKVAKTDKYTMEISRAAYTKPNISYSKLYEEALSKVNTQTKKILESIKEEITTFSEVAAGYKIREGVIPDKIKGLVGGLLKKIKLWWSDLRVIDNEHKKMEKILKSIKESGDDLNTVDVILDGFRTKSDNYDDKWDEVRGNRDQVLYIVAGFLLSTPGTSRKKFYRELGSMLDSELLYTFAGDSTDRVNRDAFRKDLFAVLNKHTGPPR